MFIIDPACYDIMRQFRAGSRPHRTSGSSSDRKNGTQGSDGETIYPNRMIPEDMAGSWQEARKIAQKEGKEMVFHDYDAGSYGVCVKSDRPGHFSCGRYVEHRCICMPAELNPEELEQKEKKFLEENPEWLDSS